MYKRVALIILIISLALLAVGIFVFVDRQAKDNTDELVNNPTAKQNEDLSADNELAGQIPPENDDGEAVIDWDKRLAELEAEIEKKARRKFNQVTSAAADRHYTADEREFLTRPDLYIINEMEANGEISAEEAIKLKANHE